MLNNHCMGSPLRLNLSGSPVGSYSFGLFGTVVNQNSNAGSFVQGLQGLIRFS